VRTPPKNISLRAACRGQLEANSKEAWKRRRTPSDADAAHDRRVDFVFRAKVIDVFLHRFTTNAPIFSGAFLFWWISIPRRAELAQAASEAATKVGPYFAATAARIRRVVSIPFSSHRD